MHAAGALPPRSIRNPEEMLLGDFAEGRRSGVRQGTMALPMASLSIRSRYNFDTKGVDVFKAQLAAAVRRRHRRRRCGASTTVRRIHERVSLSFLDSRLLVQAGHARVVPQYGGIWPSRLLEHRSSESRSDPQTFNFDSGWPWENVGRLGIDVDRLLRRDRRGVKIIQYHGWNDQTLQPE